MNRRTFTTRTLTAIAGLFGASRVSAEVVANANPEQLYTLEKRTPSGDLIERHIDLSASQLYGRASTQSMRDELNAMMAAEFSIDDNGEVVASSKTPIDYTPMTILEYLR